jgi:hypothetical protein
MEHMFHPRLPKTVTTEFHDRLIVERHAAYSMHRDYSTPSGRATTKGYRVPLPCAIMIASFAPEGNHPQHSDRRHAGGSLHLCQDHSRDKHCVP